MKKKSLNSTVNYDPVEVSINVEISFTKIVNATTTTITGTIRKDGANVGSVSYDAKGNYLLSQIKPYDALTFDEIKAVYNSVSDCIAEILND